MSDYAAIINLPDHKRGDKWPGITSIGPVIINDAQPATPLARIRMQFRRQGHVFTLDSDPAQSRNAAVQIDNATTWEASIPEVQGFLPAAGEWAWDMEFYAVGDQAPLTLYKGDITVNEDVTR